MASSVAPGKKALRDFLKVTSGLTEADGVIIRSADPLPEEMARELVILGSTTVTEDRAGLAGREEQVSVSCWAIAVEPGSGETAVDAARDRADELLSLVRDALTSPAAVGLVAAPGDLQVTGGSLTESPVAWDQGIAARRADRAFTVSWISHVT